MFIKAQLAALYLATIGAILKALGLLKVTWWWAVSPALLVGIYYCSVVVAILVVLAVCKTLNRKGN